MKNILLIIALFSVSFVLCQNSSSLAESYFREGAYEKASQIYESLEKNNPFNTRYLKRLITCYQETSNYEKAANLLQKKLLNNPSQHYLRIEIGYNFDQQKKPTLAKKEYDFAIEAIESNPSLGGIMGRMFHQMLMVFSEMERQMIAERNHEKRYQTVKSGRPPGGRAPIGYDYINSKLVVNKKYEKIYIFSPFFSTIIRGLRCISI